MNVTQTLNTYIAPFSILILILIDYYRNKSADYNQHKIFLIVVFMAIITIFVDITYELLVGVPDGYYKRGFSISAFLYFVLQPIAHNSIVLFLDYNVNRKLHRIKSLSYVIFLMTIMGIVVLLININSGFLYSVSPDNEFIRGESYSILLLILCLPALLGIIDAVLCYKNINRNQMVLFLIFVILPLLGGFIDLIVGKTRLLWPSYCIAILFAYLFIIQSENHIDSLTKVNNRRSFDELLSNIEKIEKRKPYVFVMIDMDRFKQINDVFGHSQGDMALKDVAQLLKESVRQNDFIARYGGDEFVIIIKDAGDANAVVRRIQHNVDKFNARELRNYTLALSIGYDTYVPENEMPPNEFLAHIDALMYENKEKRRNEIT